MKENIFLYPNDYLFMGVAPYQGKYAAKHEDFFQAIRSIQQEHMDSNWVYRPLNSEIEITNKCNQSCPHCGMAANGMTGQSYNLTELEQYIDQLYENGIISFSITGGEPFLEFDNMKRMLKHAKGKVDICKITSNGFWGADADWYFQQLVEAGLLNNRFLVPCIMVSIGEQVTSMEDTCNIINYAIKNFSVQELTICISSLKEYGAEGKIGPFIDTYNRNFGEIPKGRIYLTENYYRNSDSIRNSAMDVAGRHVADYMIGPMKCFAPTIGKYILPRLLIKATGEVCTCACFNPPRRLCIGNFRKQPLGDILTDINSSSVVKEIAVNGLHGFKKWIDIDQCREISCNNECDACRILLDRCEGLID